MSIEPEAMAWLGDDPLAVALVIVLALAALVWIAAIWMIVRARKAPSPPAAAPPGANGNGRRLWRLARAARAAVANAIATLRYLGTRNEWRYRLPWILVAGEAGAGKTSLAASIGEGRRVRPVAREEKLAFEDTDWRFFERGVLIDLDGAASPDADDAEHRRWREVLRRLSEHRPERPLDGVVLALSARTLLGASSADLQRLMQRCRAQLEELHERLEFALPVYVVITQCDAIEGFAAYWNAQPEKRRAEMLGWSSPYPLEHNLVPEWLDAAFDEIGSGLKLLQLQAAAINRDIEQGDEFFLFPQRFRELLAPLRALLPPLFQPSPYQPSAFVRGIYFTGSIEAGGAAAPQPRADVAFVDQLFEEKIYAELHLARPIRQALWSRHRLVRRLQYGAAALFAVLCLSLAHAGLRLHRQVDAGIASLNLIKNPQRLARDTGGCVERQTVYELLTNVSNLDMSLMFTAIPASWLDRRAAERGTELVADSAFEEVIFPSLACHLRARAHALLAEPEDGAGGEGPDGHRKRLHEYTGRVLALETNIARFRRLAVYSASERAGALIEELDALARYLYGEPLPPIVHRRRGQHRQALAHVEYDPRSLELPAELRARVRKRVAALADQARGEIDREIDTGAALLQRLNRNAGPTRIEARRFQDWLERMRAQWLSATPQSNPCHRTGARLEDALSVLRRDFGYGASLLAPVRAFDDARCYRPAMGRLGELRAPPHGVLFRGEAGQWALAPAFAAEADGFKRALALDFMQIAPRDAFACRLPLHGWRAADLAEAAGYIREYEQFADAQPRSGNAQPLYLESTRRQLQAVLDHVINRAQIRAGYDDARTLVAATSADDLALEVRSAEFARVLEPLAWVLRMYRQLGFDGGHARIAQCARAYAAQTLRTIEVLSEASRLYEPTLTPAAGDGVPRPFFALGAPARIKDYLDRQLGRVQVLATYAAPFVTFLKNTEGVNDAALADGETYWDETIGEVNQFVQFKVPNGQVAALNDLFVGRLGAMNADNCAERLAEYEAPAYGNDLFSRRRHALESQAEVRCYDRGRAAAYANYQGLARRFSAALAGRFPFGPPDGGVAPFGAVRSFFLDYAEQRESLREQLEGLRSDDRDEIVAFLDALDRAAAFFGPNVAAPEAAQPLRLEIEFRAHARRSPGAQNVVNWRLDTGDPPPASHPNGRRELVWRPGQPVSLDLEWAALAPVAPHADPTQTDMRVDGNTVSFRADGPWALLELVRRHTPRSAPRVDPADPDVVLLEFRVPTRARDAGAKDAPSEARVYLGVKFQGVDPETQAAVTLDLPRRFPTSTSPF